MPDPTSGLIPGSGPALARDIGDFPFRAEFSLAPMIDFWARAGSDASPACSSMARAVGEQLAQAPGLERAITDPAILERYEDAVDMLMSAEIPPAAWEHAYAAAMIPFQLRGFYATPRMRQDMLDEGGRLKGRLNIDDRLVSQLRRGYAYVLILRRVYGVDVELDYTPTLTVPDRDTGLDRHYRLLFDSQFVDVEVVGERPPLPDDVRRRLQAMLLEPGAMERILPPDRFVLRGVTFLKAIDVTDQEVLSALKRDLIDRESIVSPTRFAELQTRLRTLLRRPELRLGLAALAGERVLLLNYGAKIEHACIFADSVHHRKEEFVGTVYQRAVTSGKPLIVDDLGRLPTRTVIEDPDGGGRAAGVPGRPAALPGPDHRDARARLAPPGRSGRLASAQACRGAAALLDGRATQHGRVQRAHPDADQGALHRDSSGRRVAIPQGGARRAGARG